MGMPPISATLFGLTALLLLAMLLPSLGRTRAALKEIDPSAATNFQIREEYMRIRTFIASLAMAVGLNGVAEAKHSEKPIKMIVAYSPGGSTDLKARLLAAYMEKYLDGATIIVENRPGAGGEIGVTALAQATPDGYTIGFVNTPNVLSIPIERKVKYHWTQFDLLGNVLDDPGGFSVNKDGPIKTLRDLVDFAKANPFKVTVGASGVGYDDQLAMIAFEKIAGLKMTHVPFPGVSAVKTAVSGGHIVVGGMNIG